MLARGRRRAHIYGMEESPESRPPSSDALPTRPAASAAERERAVDRLRAHYVRDDIDVEEYERLVDVAWAADSRAELDHLLSALPALPESERPAATAAAAARVAARASPGEQRERGFQIAILGGSERKGSWVPPKRLHTFTLMGGAGLDFREARLGPGLTEVTILAVMGGVEVVVPPGLTVETHGFGIMGGFDGHSQTVDSDDPSSPVLRIRGLALMGGIDVKMRLPGETERDARRRLKEERRRGRLERAGE